MAKLTTNTIAGAYASTTELNDNFALVEAAIEKCLFLDGTSPNIMSADIDLNGNDILNVGNIAVTGAAREGTEILSTGETGAIKYLREDGDNTSSWQPAVAEGTAILSTGESGGTKYLREDGDGTSSWQAVASGAGQWVLLEDRAVTATTPLTFTWDETAYDEIKLHLINLAGASGTDRQLEVQVGYANGTSFHSTNLDYNGTYREFKDLTLTAQAVTDAHACGGSVINVDATYEGLSGYIKIISGSQEDTGCIIESMTHHVYGGGSGDMVAYEAKSYLEPLSTLTTGAGVIDSARLYWDGGTINFSAFGKVRMYGLKNS